MLSDRIPMNKTDSPRQKLIATAEQRLHPSLTNPNYLVLRSRRIIFEKWIKRLGSHLTVLDIGGRYQPYRPLLESRIRRYFAVDVIQTELVDVVGNGEALPFAASSFDLAIATQVFEYFSEPIQAGNQIHRVLKPGGALLMSVAAVAPQFVFKERWRFTPAGVRTALSSFSQVDIVPETLSTAGLLRMANVGVHTILGRRLLQQIFGFSVCPFLNLLGLCAEGLRLSNNDQFVPNYSVLALKDGAVGKP